MKKKKLGYVFILPWLVGFAAFVLGPFLASLYFSMTRYDLVSQPLWVGFANYKKLFSQDPLFWKSLAITLKFAAVAVPLGMAAGVGLALLLNLPLRGIGLYRTVFFLPSIVPVVASSVVFVWLLNPQIGVVNGILQALGVAGPAWLQSKVWAFWSLVGMSLWSVGGSMVIYLAGLKDIPRSLYESATLDGAGAFDRTLHITLPLLTPVIFFNLVMGIIGAFQYFSQAYIMTRGGPEESTNFIGLYLFNRAWRYLDMGYASAMAWMLFLVVLLVTALLLRGNRRWVHYER